MRHNPEYRLTPGSGLDRSGNHKNSARTTDKGLEKLGIYSLLSRNNKMKRELTLGATQKNFSITPLAKTKLSEQICAHILYGVKTVRADHCVVVNSAINTDA